MSRIPDPLELEPAAAGLIRTGLTGDKLTTDRILTRAFEVDLDGLFFSFTIANLAGRMLVRADGRRRRRQPWLITASTSWSGTALALHPYISISAWSWASACRPASG